MKCARCSCEVPWAFGPALCPTCSGTVTNIPRTWADDVAALRAAETERDRYRRALETISAYALDEMCDDCVGGKGEQLCAWWNTSPPKCPFHIARAALEARP